jgi:pimeloyl-ACP methyl ester carboxylesterase
LWIVLLFASLSLFGCEDKVLAQDEYGEGPPFAEQGFHAGECPFEVLEGEEITCGYLTVPENRADPEGATIDLAVAVLPATGMRPRNDPILYLEGGPGGSALADPDFWLESPLLTSRDVILLDQRGTGYSFPTLDCPEVDAFDAGEETGYADTIEATAACRDRLTLDGVDLAQYNSAASAADVEDLRLALGVEQWNLYGVSYGTRLALTVMRDYPNGIRSVILDSVYPPNSNGYTEDPLNSITAIETLIEGCEQDAECDANFPDLMQRFYAVVEDLNTEPVEIDGVTTTGDDLVNFLFNSLYDSALIPYLPLVIFAAAEEDYEPWSVLDQYANGEEFGAVRSAPAEEPRQDDEPPVNDADAQGMFYSVECNESVSFIDREEAEELVEEYPTAITEGLLEGLDEMIAICELWGAGEADTIESDAVYSEIPTLIVAGEYDPITPARWGQLSGETLPNSVYVEMQRGGHGVTFDDECGARVVRAFLNRPERRPNASCMEDEYYPFVYDKDELP